MTATLRVTIPGIIAFATVVFMAGQPRVEAAEGVSTLKHLSGGDLQQLTRVGQHVFFTVTPNARSGGCGPSCELWKSDGTPQGTARVFQSLSYAGQLTNVGGTLFFTTGGSASALWKSDGTPGGTMPLADLGNTAPHSLTDVGGTLYFGTSEGLWVSDGTPEGTRFVADGSFPPGKRIVSSNGTAFFLTYSALWRTDGTGAGTEKVFEARGHTLTDGSPHSLVARDGEVFFSGVSRNGKSWALWGSNGTSAGTRLVSRRPVPDFEMAYFSPGDLTPAGSMIFFAASGRGGDWHLWRSLGTPGGTSPLARIPGPMCASGNGGGATCFATPTGTAVDGQLFFGVKATELWRSDGTPAGTDSLGAPGGSLHRFVDVGGTLYFGAADNLGSVGLWKSDGTTLGTLRVANLAGLFLDEPVNLNGSLVFVTRATSTTDLLILATTAPCGDERPGSLEKALCELRELPGVLVCENDQRPLSIDANAIESIESLIRSAATAPPRRAVRLRRQAARSLRRLAKPIPALVRSGGISSPCAAALAYRIRHRGALITGLRP